MNEIDTAYVYSPLVLREYIPLFYKNNRGSVNVFKGMFISMKLKIITSISVIQNKAEKLLRSFATRSCFVVVGLRNVSLLQTQSQHYFENIIELFTQFANFRLPSDPCFNPYTI